MQQIFTLLCYEISRANLSLPNSSIFPKWKSFTNHIWSTSRTKNNENRNQFPRTEKSNIPKIKNEKNERYLFNRIWFHFWILKRIAFLAPEIIQNHSSVRRNSTTTLQPPIFHIFPVDQILFFFITKHRFCQKSRIIRTKLWAAIEWKHRFYAPIRRQSISPCWEILKCLAFLVLKMRACRKPYLVLSLLQAVKVLPLTSRLSPYLSLTHHLTCQDSL